jgi:Leucine-rich repeat (LRR) protein
MNRFNEFTTIDSNTFKSLVNLEHLDLSHNSIESIELGSFSNLTRLKKLRLDHNRLSNWNFSSCLNKLVSLEQLCLVSNGISSLEINECLTPLRFLNLSQNELTLLPKNAFANLPNLVNLNLSQNEINEAESGAFDGLIHLRTLNLAGNDLVELDLSVFGVEGLANLMLLDLDTIALSVEDKNDSSAQIAKFFFSRFRNRVIVCINYSREDIILKELAIKGLIHLDKNISWCHLN